MVHASATSSPSHPRAGVTTRGPADEGRIAHVFACMASPPLGAVKFAPLLYTSIQLCLICLIISLNPMEKTIMLAVAEEAATTGTLVMEPIVHTPTITPLYDLIGALQDQIVPEDDAAVTAAVVHLFNAGYVKFRHFSNSS